MTFSLSIFFSRRLVRQEETERRRCLQEERRNGGRGRKVELYAPPSESLLIKKLMIYHKWNSSGYFNEVLKKFYYKIYLLVYNGVRPAKTESRV